jgi:hypothetical protein
MQLPTVLDLLINFEKRCYTNLLRSVIAYQFYVYTYVLELADGEV